jgi:uncharacterized protein (TIGR02679 family)
VLWCCSFFYVGFSYLILWRGGNGYVWVVENSGVCSALLDEVANASIACTHGQFKVASWLFFEKLVLSGCMIHYSGDIDPEGLVMAERLKKRYPEQVIIWRMDSASYLTAISEESVAERLTQLRNIEAQELQKTAEMVIQHGFAAYQEGLIDLLVADIRKTI